MNSSPPSAACMFQTVSIVSGNGLLPFQHQAISSVPEPCWLKINWTLRNNPIKFISPCYLIHLFITVHKNWIELELKENELNWNWIERFRIWFELELNWIEKSWIQLELELNWKKWIDPSPDHGTHEITLAGSHSLHWGRVQWKIPCLRAKRFSLHRDNFLKRRRLVTWLRDLAIKMAARWIQIWDLI